MTKTQMPETRWWLLSMAAAALLIVLLALHFAVMHYSPVFVGQSIEQARSLEMLLARGRDTVQMIVYILFLAAALYHGLYGLRGIVLELPWARVWGRAIQWMILLVGVGFFIYGAYVTWWTWRQ